MAKKKKHTLKAAANRGFATTSTPSKKVEVSPKEEDVKPTGPSDTPQRAQQNGAAKGVANGAQAAKSAESNEFEADSEEMELMNLLDRLGDRADREVARLWKAVEFDQRLASNLPPLELDKSLHSEAVALSDSKISLAELDKALPSISLGNASQNESPAETAPTSGLMTPELQDKLSPLPNTLLDEEKLFTRVLTTYGLLQKLGFTSRQAELALAANTGAYELEDCTSFLVETLSDEALVDVERRQKGLKGKEQQQEAEESAKEVDESVPPTHRAYSFERKISPRGALHSQLKGSSGDASPSLSQSHTPSAESDLEIAELTQRLRRVAASCASVYASIEGEISDGQSGEGLMDTLETPSTAWGRAKLGQIRIERLKGQQSKLVRSGASSSAAFDGDKLAKLSNRLRDVIKDAERQRDFSIEVAGEFLRQEKEQWEEEVRREDEESEKERQELQGDVPPTKKKGAASNKSDNAQSQQNGKNEENNDSAAAVDGDGDGDKEEQDADGDMFGGLLDEASTEIKDAVTGESVSVRPLPLTVKGGRTPRSVLAESLRRIDPAASTRFEAVSTGGRLYRSRMTLKWPGPEGKKSSENYLDVYQLTGEAAESQSAADDMLATLALNCISDTPSYRSLPGPYRDWNDEIDAHRKAERSSRGIQLLKRIKLILQPRLDEIHIRKQQAKKPSASSGAEVTISDPQTSVGALAHGRVRELSAEAAERQQAWFETRKEGPLFQKMLPQRQSLPIFKYREHIIDVLENNQVFVLSGETGCGKSTQVPAYILEHCMAAGKPCKIYCTEPRRISAISLAERVSQELGEPKGAVGGDDSLVGYAIRLDSHIGREARLVYATSGILLRMLEGTSVNEVTHIIIDEVHERSIESDFLLIILKTLLTVRKDLKVILMSATLDAERISQYCGGCPTVSVPGRTFPVQTNYLEDAVELTNYTIEDDSQYAIRPRRDRYGRKSEVPGNKAKLQSTADDDLPPDDDDDDEDDERSGAASESLASGARYSPKTISTMDRMDEYVINHDLIVSLIERICFSPDLEQFSSAILVFMPGIQDIRKLHDLLTTHKAFGSNRFIVSPLHSTLSSEEQSSVFNIPPQGMRKIVISTNIAETGVTIPDVTCVIDSGKHREMRFDEKRQTSRLVDCFVAKSNAKQRRGRAGRVQEGICFHLFTKQRHDKYLAEHPLPEMLRLSLQDLALKLKIMKIKIGNSIQDALSQALDPPSPTNVQRAVAALIEVKALTTTEEVTPLGRHLARIPLDVHMGKFLLIATMFKCLDAALTIAAALNSKSPFITPFGREAEADLAKASFKVGNSDFLTIANAFNSFRRAVSQKHHYNFCRKSFLSVQTLQQIEELRQQYMAFLIDSGFVQLDDQTKQTLLNIRYRSGGGIKLMDTPKELDVNGNSITVLHTALAIGLYPKVISIEPRTYQLRTIGNNQPTSIHPSSINFQTRLGDLSPGLSHLIYFTIMQSRKLYVRELAPIQDISLILLCGSDLDLKFSSKSMYLDKNKFRMKVASDDSWKALVTVKILREQMMKLFNSCYKNPGKMWSSNQVKAFQIVLKGLGAFANDQDKFQK
ncbi:unnamed protein product [Sympodiomycopsis kandeliae]